MEFLKWYLIVGVIVNIIAEIYNIYNVKKYGYAGNNDLIKNCNIFVKVMAYCGSFALQVICWLPLVIFLYIVYVITGRLNK